MLRLPSFSSLIAFDAVARHGTLMRAAVELNVSQPAISRRITALEQDLGHPLFNRSTRPLTLTKSGMELFDALSTSLNRLSLSVDRIRRHTCDSTVTISVGAGIAAYWLTPRLSRIQAAHPQLQLRIISQSHVSADDSSGDLQIRFGEGRWPGVEASKLRGETVFPVCAPTYFGQRKTSLSVEQLAAQRLLDMKVSHQPWFDWLSWFEHVDQPQYRKLDLLVFDSYTLVVNAALSGQGVCLAWAGILDDLLESGKLVRISALEATSSRGYFVTFDRGLASDAPARTIARFLATDCASATDGASAANGSPAAL